ncbi:MAG: NAD(P)-dependent glycerol-3-phosphate dehydrogenase [Candidatus Omnitrophica bacterium]|nr:NAD(P)-dependent glycerol-3-phosphate dehydrogenase [Candidatus Omnitrophota bacterium]
MNKKIPYISIIGDGGWGTTLAVYLARKNYPVKLWGAFPEYTQHMQESRFNRKFLPGVEIPSSVEITSDLATSINDSDIIVLAVPSQFLRSVLKKIKKLSGTEKRSGISLKNKIIVSVVKGIETTTLMRVSEIVQDILGNVTFAAFSGPTIAGEVVKKIPTTAVIASKNIKVAKTLQEIFNSDTFRIYTNADVIGVEIGGSLKNVIAIACGVCDGLNYGTNTKAAIVTRGLAEISTLGTALGAKPKTFSGLTGLGDLITTCFSPQSRNRTVGEQLGKGVPITQILESTNTVAEGVETAKAAYRLSVKYKIPMPLITEIYNILFKNKSPAGAVTDLMHRKTHAE